jgi:cardiolipin synthase
MRRWIPNGITISRGLAGPLIALLLLGWRANDISFWLFVAAISSDLLDGFAARWLDAHSDIGEWLDPVADKALTLPIWATLAWIGWAPVWLSLAILGRTAVIGVGWAWSPQRSPPTPVGQVMVAFEGVAVAVLVFHGPWNGTHWPSVGTALGGISLALSLVSLAQYAAVRAQRGVLPPTPPPER